MKRLLFALFLLALPASAATIYVDNNGSNTSPYDTCAKAATTLETAVGAWTAGDVIWVNDEHAETDSSGGVTYSSANDTPTAPLLIYSVDFSDGAGGCSGTDAYTPGSAVQVDVTGAGNDIFFQGSFAVYGLYMRQNDNFNFCLTGEDAVSRFYDMTVEFDSSTALFVVTEQNCTARIYNLTLKSEGAGDNYKIQNTATDVDIYGLVLEDTVATAGLINSTQNNATHIYDVDMSALTGTPTLVDSSAGAPGDYTIVRFVGGALPAAFSATDGNDEAGDWVLFSGMDADGAGANASRTELYMEQGTVKTDYATYHDNGWSDADGGNLSYAFVTTSSVGDGYPLCSWPISSWINSTGSKTFTVYINHDFTASPDKSEVWLELSYLGTTNATHWTLDIGEDVLGSTAMTAGAETWTEPSCHGGTCTDEKFTETVTINKAGLWQARICTTKYEANKTLWVDPLIGVS